MDNMTIEFLFKINFKEKLEEVLKKKGLKKEEIIEKLKKEMNDLDESKLKKELDSEKIPKKNILSKLLIMIKEPINTFLPPYANFIRDLRNRYGLSLDEFGAKCGDNKTYSGQSIFSYENGHQVPNIEILYSISRLSKVSINQILEHGIENEEKSILKLNDLILNFNLLNKEEKRVFLTYINSVKIKGVEKL